MRSYDAQTNAYLAARGGVIARHLVWITGRDRNTDAPQSLGLWTGSETRSITIGGQARTYAGAGAMLALEPITAGMGLDVRILQARFAPVAPAVQAALLQYDPRFAPVEIHRALFDPVSWVLVSEPHRVFRGWVNKVLIREGDPAEAVVDFASAARGLTRALTLRRSDAAMRQRSATDAFRAYTDISGDVGVWWGERRRDPRAATRPGASISAPTPINPVETGADYAGRD